MTNLIGGELAHRGLFRGLGGSRNAENTAKHCHQQAGLQVKAGKHTEKSFFLMSVIPILFAALSMRLGGRLNNFLRSEIYAVQAKFRRCAQLLISIPGSCNTFCEMLGILRESVFNHGQCVVYYSAIRFMRIEGETLMLDKCDNRFGLMEKKAEYVEHTLNQVKTDLATLTMRSVEFVTKGDLHKEVGLLRREIGLVHKEMANQTKWMVSTILVVAGLCMTAAKFWF
ncbi:hypothetical protein [Serratia proteamaculans]|uniref:hypothetical protein n=1 Tax=Serratia proteamaculans TaxID=28151 RepID=UPI0021BDB522|nr:hypothetical protein [Serratia proteamaculans]